MKASCRATCLFSVAVVLLSIDHALANHPFDGAPMLPPLAASGNAPGGEYLSPMPYNPSQPPPMEMGGMPTYPSEMMPSYPSDGLVGPYGGFDGGPMSFDHGAGACCDYADAGCVPGGYLEGGPMFDPAPGVDRLFNDSPPIWTGYLSSLYQPGTDRSIWNGEWFQPLWQDGRNLWYFNMRGQVDSDEASELNVGTGFRTLASPGWVFGSYVFYDRLWSSNNNGFNQATFGVEAMDVFWDFRFNVYFPESKAKSTSIPPSATISNGTIVVSSGEERAYWGFDVETGALLWSCGPNMQHEVRGFVGVYHFDHSADGYDSITGPRARMEWRWYDLNYFGAGSRFTCGFSVQADTERGADLYGFLGLRIPLDCLAHRRRPLTPLERRMVDPVVRDVDVVTNSRQHVEAAVNPQSGQTISSVHVVKSGDDLAQLIPKYQRNSVVVVDGKNGQLASSSAISLQRGQTVIGGGGKLVVQGANSGKIATWTAPGTRPTVAFGSTGGASSSSTLPGDQMPTGFRMADGTMLSALDIRGGRPGVAVESAEQVLIKDVQVRDAHGAGVALTQSQHVTLENVRVDDVGGSAYIAPNYAGQGSPSNVFEAAKVHQGVGIAGAQSSHITLKGVRVQDTQQAGIRFVNSQQIRVDDAVIENSRGPGLSFLKSENVVVSKIELEDVGSYQGYSADAPPDGVMDPHSGSSATTSTDWSLKQAGIELRETKDVELSGLSLERTGRYGIWADDATDTTISETTIQGADNGIWIENSHGLDIEQSSIKLASGASSSTGAAVADPLLDGTGDGWVSGDIKRGIVLQNVTGAAAIHDTDIRGGTNTLGIWTRSTTSGNLDLSLSENHIVGHGIWIDHSGGGPVAARLSQNRVEGQGAGVIIDGEGTGTTNVGLFENQLRGDFRAESRQEHKLNLALEGNELGAGSHRIKNDESGVVRVRYRENDSLGDVIFKEQSGDFGLEPLSGNNHSPVMEGHIKSLDPGAVQSLAPGIFP